MLWMIDEESVLIQVLALLEFNKSIMYTSKALYCKARNVLIFSSFQFAMRMYAYFFFFVRIHCFPENNDNREVKFMY